MLMFAQQFGKHAIYELPSRKKLSGGLLDDAYENAMDRVNCVNSRHSFDSWGQ